MKKLFVISCFIIAVSQLPAQTKEIAFKSHSGRTEHFKNILGDGLFDTDSDFGVAPVRTVRNAELDSVIFVSDSVAIMVTSEYCQHIDMTTKKAEGPETVWKAGALKVRNHPLFSKKHSLDSIKEVISRQYNFRNSVHNTVFIGYDNGEQQEYYSVPAAATPGDNDQSPFGPTFVLILGLVVGLSAVGAWIRFYGASLRRSQ